MGKEIIGLLPADDEDVGGASGRSTGDVLQVHDFERTDVLFSAQLRAGAVHVMIAVIMHCRRHRN